MAIDRIELAELAGLRRQAATLRLAPRRDTAAERSGPVRSQRRGRGTDFEEHRAYQPGDEARTIDWRVSARSGRLHVRMHREERERTVLLAVDLRPAMRFGTRGCFKSVLAARAAGLCAWAACERGDRVGGLAYGIGARSAVRPQSGRRGVLQLLRAWSAPAEALEGEAAAAALQRLERLASVGSLVMLFSDFRDFDDGAAQAIRRMARRSEIFLGFVSDPLEREWPDAGLYPLTDARDAHARWLDTGRERTRAAWRAAFADRRARAEALARACGARFTELATDGEPAAVLAAAFAVRATR